MFLTEINLNPRSYFKKTREIYKTDYLGHYCTIHLLERQHLYRKRDSDKRGVPALGANANKIPFPKVVHTQNVAMDSQTNG